MRHIAIAAAGVLLASASLVSASQPNSLSSGLSLSSIQLAQTSPQNQKAAPAENQKAATPKEKNAPTAAPKADAKKNETMTQKVKRTWRNWTTPSHTFCVRTPIPVPLTSKTCTAKGKTVEEARATCIKQNPLSYVTAGKC